MKLSAHVDWISATLLGKKYQLHTKNSIKRIVSGYLPVDISCLNWISTKPHNGYTSAMMSETGILVMGNPDRADMGVHIVMSGGTLANNELVGITTKSVIDFVVNDEHRMSRLDIAIDARESGLEVETLAQYADNDQWKTKARSAPYIDDKKKQGKTLYVGSMQNRTKLFRVYDKAIEQNVIGDWKRYELALYGQHAISSAKMASDTDNLESLIQGLIKGFIDFPSDKTYQEIMSSDAIKLAVPQKEQGNTEKWLLSQVAPAMAKVLELHPEFLSIFVQEVQKQRELLS